MRHVLAASLPGDITLSDLDRAFTAQSPESDSNPPTSSTAGPALFAASVGGPFLVTSDCVARGHHRHPCVTLAPSGDQRSLKVSWSDPSEANIRMSLIAGSLAFVIPMAVLLASGAVLGVLFAIPAVAIFAGAWIVFRTPAAQRQCDCDDALRAVVDAVRARA